MPQYGYYVLDRRDFEQYLNDAECLFLVASLDTLPVGYVLGPTNPWRKPPRAHIDSIAVLGEERRRGVGSRLLHTFMSQARLRGCRHLSIEVSPTNEAGMTFFTRYGFRRVRPLPDYYGRGLHGLLMATSL